jgi:hypothetical protein
MLIDSTKLMYIAFQRCRNAQLYRELLLDAQPETGLLLNLLIQTLDAVKRNDALVLEIPENENNSMLTVIQQEVELSPDANRTKLSFLSETKQRLFCLVCVGVQELKQLWTSDSEMAVQSLGYALHNIPRLLRSNEEFDPSLYRFSFRVAAAYWSELSIEMRQALCDAVELELAQVEELVCTEGFAIHMWSHMQR